MRRAGTNTAESSTDKGIGMVCMEAGSPIVLLLVFVVQTTSRRQMQV